MSIRISIPLRRASQGARRGLGAAATALALLSASSLTAAASSAALPAAGKDAAAYPWALDSPAAFDRASRLEILAYAQALAAIVPDDKPPASSADVRSWRAWMLSVLQQNFVQARGGCSGDGDVMCAEPAKTPAEFVDLATGFDRKLPAGLTPWYQGARDLYRQHVADQRTEAAYFGIVATEIGIFDAHETIGLELPDKTFQLSFDDGPTSVGEDTDKTVALLRAHDLHALFFLLGNTLQARRKAEGDEALRRLYSGQCPASHGRVHDSHAKMPDWEASIASTHAALQDVFPQSPSVGLFRPPWGRRRPQTSAFVQQWGGRVVLWNVDSKDWDAKTDAADIPRRVLALMLAWRRGIVLMHDVHPKARAALPRILAATAGSGIRWMDCRDLR